MALAYISSHINSNRQLMSIIKETFDSVELIEKKISFKYSVVYIYRILDEDVPTDDCVVELVLLEIKGIKPFIVIV